MGVTSLTASAGAVGSLWMADPARGVFPTLETCADLCIALGSPPAALQCVAVNFRDGENKRQGYFLPL